MMPINDPRDRFFYPHHTPMKDTYNLLWGYGVDTKICHEGLGKPRDADQ